jgi:hypothetical protein
MACALPGHVPKTMRFREVAYDVKDVIGKTGIGSAGLPT